MASISRSASSSSYEPYAFAMPSAPAASFALPISREAIAATSANSHVCIPGITRAVAIFAAPRTPKRIFFATLFIATALLHPAFDEIGVERAGHKIRLVQNAFVQRNRSVDALHHE